MRVRMKHDLRAAADGPPNGFRIPPPFMTNHNTKGQRPGGEDPTSGPEHRIGSFLWRIELGFVLPPGNRAIGIDHQCRDLQAAVGHALRAEDDRNAGLSRRVRHIGPRLLEKGGIGRRRWHAWPPISRNEAFRKAHQIRASAAGIGYGGCRKADGLLAGRWNANVREGDADCAQSGLSSAVKTQ
jgi:hypothetical protein